jgi:type IV pilus assembly protein PilC
LPEYSYTAKDRSGQLIEGTVSADNSALAVGKVRELGYFPEKVRALTAPKRDVSFGQQFKETFIYPVSSGVPLKDLAIFYRQFATMINAGIPLFQSLATLETQTKNPQLAGILRDCQRQVGAGGKLSDVFSNYSWVFSELQIEMIRAAEHGGMLQDMLLRLSGYLEQELALRRMISRLTLYPKIVIFVAWYLLGVKFFIDATPAFSKLIIGMMKSDFNYSFLDYLKETFFPMIILGVIAFGIVAFCRIVLFQSESAQESYERFKLAIPGLGSVIKKFALAKFGRAFGAMYAAGLPLNTAIRTSGNASGSKVISRAIQRILTSTERGAVLSQAFRETGVFPPIVVDMLHTGEQTGNIDTMMDKVAEYLEGDAESKAHQYSHIFAAAVFLVVAIAIGYALIKFYGGIGANVQSQINSANGE